MGFSYYIRYQYVQAHHYCLSAIYSNTSYYISLVTLAPEFW